MYRHLLLLAPCLALLVACNSPKNSLPEDTAHTSGTNPPDSAAANEFENLLQSQGLDLSHYFKLADVTVVAGQDATFSVESNGKQARWLSWFLKRMTFSWKKGEQVLTDCRTRSCTLSKVSVKEAGVYTVIISKGNHVLGSLAATLTVTNDDGGNDGDDDTKAAPKIIKPLADQSVTIGSKPTFTVEAAGSKPLTYRWRFKGVDYPSCISNVCSLTAQETSVAGGPFRIEVTVSNNTDKTADSSAGLTVTKSNGDEGNGTEEDVEKLVADAYYVSPSGNDNNPGTYEKPWRTIAYAVSRDSPIKAGQTVYVAPGTYNPFSFEKDEIRVIGYKGIKGQFFQKNEFVVNVITTQKANHPFGSLGMPTIDGNDRASDQNCVSLYDTINNTFANFLIRQCGRGLIAGNGANDSAHKDGHILNNLGLELSGDVDEDYSGANILLGTVNSSTANDIVVKNIFSRSSAAELLSFRGYRNRFKKIVLFGLESGNASTDYGFLGTGSNNYAEDILVYRAPGSEGHYMHSVSLKGFIGVDGYLATENNHFKNITCIGSGECGTFRHHNVKNNLMEDIYVYGTYDGSQASCQNDRSAGPQFRDGASDNTVRHVTAKGVCEGVINFVITTEDTSLGVAGNGNLVDGVKASSSLIGINYAEDGLPGPAGANTIQNATFDSMGIVVMANRDSSQMKYSNNSYTLNTYGSFADGYYSDQVSPNGFMGK